MSKWYKEFMEWLTFQRSFPIAFLGFFFINGLGQAITGRGMFAAAGAYFYLSVLFALTALLLGVLASLHKAGDESD